MIDLKQREVWFVTGSQHLYGPRTLEQVAANSREIANALGGLSEFTRIKFGGTGSGVDLIIYGGLLTAVAVFQPTGLVGLVRRWRRR